MTTEAGLVYPKDSVFIVVYAYWYWRALKQLSYAALIDSISLALIFLTLVCLGDAIGLNFYFFYFLLAYSGAMYVICSRRYVALPFVRFMDRLFGPETQVSRGHCFFTINFEYLKNS